MARRPVPAWGDLRLGIFFLVAAVALLWFLMVVVTNQRAFVRTYELKIHMNNAQGLSKGAMVSVSGLEAGRVSDIQFARLDSSNVLEVTLAVPRKHRPRITKASEATIRTIGVLGDKFIDISLGDPNQPALPPGSILPLRGDIDWTATFERASLVMDDLTDFARNASETMASLNRGEGALAALIRDPETAQRLKATASNLAAVTQKLRAGDGTAARLLSDPAAFRKLDSVLDRLDHITALADSGDGALARILSDRELGLRLESFIAGSDSLVAAVRGQGTTGRLISDENLYQDMTSTLSELRDLLQDIRENPRKYIKVSMF